MLGRIVALPALSCVLLCASAEAAAQSTWMLGGSVGMPYYREFFGGLDLISIGFNFTQVSAERRIGGDFSVFTFPVAVKNGVVLLGSRLGLALPLKAGRHVMFVPSGGATLVGGAGSGGATARVGANAGMATVLWAGETGLRLGATFHTFQDVRGVVWLFEIGFVGGRPARP